MVIKNLIDRNQLKKFMQVGVDVKCIHTNSGRHGLFGFESFVPFIFHASRGVHVHEVYHLYL